ncbi:MAG: glycosyltransferase family 4 protein [Flavobacteriaceae bacterium]|nr:glycosyltransferase family 4 protein [Flavobacteriaceae bacterium]
MKSVLVIVNTGKIAQNQNGGASVYYSHLELLSKAGFKIELLTVSWDDNTPFNEDDYHEIRPFINGLHHYTIKSVRPKKNLKRLYNAVFNPATFEYFFINSTNENYLKSFVLKNNIDFVWAEWRWAGIWVRWTDLNVPVIYAHHDWEYKLALLRSKPNFSKRFHTFQKKRIEKQLVKGVTACVSGSFTEANEITEISTKPALYLPTTYKEVQSKLRPRNKPAIVHLGGMGTTANRLGLERFLEICWPQIKSEIQGVKLIVIGGLEPAQPALKEKLKDPNITCLGFVSQLDEVLHSYDIHIIPWEYNTGTRTRIPLVFNYSQVLVATAASAACYPELEHEKNCILCTDLPAISKQIANLYKDQNKILKLARQGKQTFKNSFTSESQTAKLKEFLKTIL